MKKSFVLSLLLVTCMMAFAQATKPQWTKVTSNSPETFQTQLISSNENSIKVCVQVPGFYTTTVTTPKGEAKVITVPKSVSTALAGEPDMPMSGIPLMIGDKARMAARVIDAQYMDFEGIEIAPSKGDFSRQIDPAKVPYTYGECYSKDAFFPASNLDLYEPYIIRDFRGQNMAIYPFAYNPVTKTLRVYYNMTVELYKIDNNGKNVIETRRGNEVKMDPDFKSVYQRHFLNYEEGMAKYTPVDEDGDLLIICYDNFISSMTDFVNWKKTRGINTTIVGTNTAGSSYTAIKNYIQSQYNANNNITHVLLVGDVAQIPGYTYSGASGYEGKGDNPYGQIVGNDIYNDVFIGRFSASSAAQVTTQVNRTINYEQNLTTSDTWCQNGLGISTTEGSGGHNSEDDYQHIENLRTDLLNYGYNTVYQDYKSVSGYPSSTTTTISNHINSGVGIINYCNHGEQTGWQSHYYMNSNVNALTNNNKLPFIFSVACLVGQYDYSSGDCFAETWMHATNGSSPTGAIGGAFSYISQPWIPPMWAQDEFVDILCELKNNNIKRTLGGAMVNGMMAIFDNYSTSTAMAVGTYQAWVVYGDPTLMMRTKTPQAMTVTHNGNITIGVPTYTVNVANGNGAVATITDTNHNILGKATVSNGTATISLNSSNLTAGTELTLCVFGYNKVTYLDTINVVGGQQYYINVTQPQHGTISAPTQAYANSTVTLTATPETGYCLSSWTVKKGNTNITVTNNQFTMPEGDVTVTATFVQGMEVTLASVMNGTINADMQYALQGSTVNLTATPASGYVFGSWVVYMTGDVNTNVTVNGNSFTMPSYPVTVSAIFTKPTGGDVTIGSGTTTVANLPTNVWYKYTTSQQIYTSAEIGSAGTITAISFKYNGNATSGARTIDIYMNHTTSTTLSTWVAVTSASKVYSGTQTFTNAGWYKITLDTPFEYNGTSNIMITVDDNTGSYTGNSGRAFYAYSTGTNRAIYLQSDSYNQTPMNPQTSTSYSANTTQYNDQIIFTKEIPSSNESLSVSPNSLAGFTYAQGQGPSEAQSITLVGCVSDDVTITAPTDFEVSLDGNAFSNTVTIPASERGSRDTQTWSFEGSFEGWTAIDADGDGYNWNLGSVLMEGYIHAGHSGDDMMCSESYHKDESGSGIALNPDNWLVSPQLTLGGTFSMYACAQDADWAAEHFGIFVSTTSGTNTNSFTKLNEWTLTAKGRGTKGGASRSGNRASGEWYEFTVDLSAYAGQTGYIAVRHFDCSDFFYLDVDDFTLEINNNGGGNDPSITPSNCEIITANVYVRLKSGLSQGTYSNEDLTIVSGSASGSVTLNGEVTEGQNSTSEQSFTLTQGWNWWAPSIVSETLLNQLLQELGSNGICIMDKDNSSFYFDSDGWIGNINALEIGKMYMIHVSSDCTLSLTGQASNPSEHPVTLIHGYNWIGFTGSQSVSLQTALTNLQPSANDIIMDKDNSSIYFEGSGWIGNINTLEPGHGYMYKSNSTETKTFTFSVER